MTNSMMPLIILFLDFGIGEIILILFAIFLLFGPKQMPEIARQVGKGMNELKKMTSDLTQEFKENASQVSKEIHEVKSTINKATVQQDTQPRADSKPDSPTNSEKNQATEDENTLLF